MKMQKCVNPVLNLNSSITRNAIVASQMLLLHNGPDTIEELFERNMVKKEKIYDSDQEKLNRLQRLTSTRREALNLYRDIVRATRFFMWPDTRGVLCIDVLRDNERREFEEARYERDPEVITSLIIGGRDSLQAALDKLVEKQKLEIAE
ncbi:hypothetical protein ACHQM5_019503 [Ranunculus cassubicifolius]